MVGRAPGNQLCPFLVPSTPNVKTSTPYGEAGIHPSNSNLPPPPKSTSACNTNTQQSIITEQCKAINLMEGDAKGQDWEHSLSIPDFALDKASRMKLRHFLQYLRM